MFKKAFYIVIILSLALGFGFKPASAAIPTSYESSVQVRNLTSTGGTIQLEFYDLTGTVIGTPFTDPIAGNETKSYYQSTLPVTAGFNGSLVISSDVPVAAMSNIVGLNSVKKAISYAAYNGFSAGSTSVYLPTLMKDNYGYNTFYYVQNTGGVDANVSVTYSDGATNSITALHPSQSAVIKQSTETHPAKVFSGKLTASASNIAVTVVEEGPSLFSYSGFAAGATNPVMPLVNQNNYGIFSGVQVMNTGTSSTVVTVSYSPSLAGTACTETRTIAGGGSETFSQFVFYSSRVETDPAFVETCTMGQTFIGSARVTANTTAQPLVAVVNQLQPTWNNGGAYTSFDPASGQSKIIYPLIMDRNYGYFTSWSIYNVGASIAAEAMVCTVTGKDKNGASVNLTIKNPSEIAANTAWTLNHQNILADGFVGGATCVGPVEARVIGTSNQLGVGSLWTGVDTLLVYEGIAVAP